MDEPDPQQWWRPNEGPPHLATRTDAQEAGGSGGVVAPTAMMAECSPIRTASW